MGEHCCGIKVGQTVPDFTLETFEPSRKDFGQRSLGESGNQGKWTVIVFYPADFTFV